ncbi:MAG: SPASM domain-containing protein [Magnetococcales bacterium]|nr:SPASM domain-containing protein [Magnetococcales bacterium]
MPYPPVSVSIEVTNVCNFRCSFCPQSDQGHLERVGKFYLNEANLFTILKKIRASGFRKNTLHWTLDGEPLMHKDFDRFCAIAMDFGFDNFFFASNALLLTQKRAQRLPPSARYTFTVDFCSDQKYFETNRGGRGSWEKIRENIVAILRDPSLGRVSFVLSDISSYSIRDPESLERRFSEMVSLFPKSGRLRFHRKTFHNSTGSVLLEGVGTDDVYHLCPYPWTTLSVSANGEVVACCRDIGHKTVLGNLFEKELMEVWNGPGYQSLRKSLADRQPGLVEACRGCDLPYDRSKFSLGNILISLRDRFQIFR